MRFPSPSMRSKSGAGLPSESMVVVVRGREGSAAGDRFGSCDGRKVGHSVGQTRGSRRRRGVKRLRVVERTNAIRRLKWRK